LGGGGFEVLAAVMMNSSTFCDIIACSPFSQPTFRRNILPFQGRTVSQTRNSVCFLPAYVMYTPSRVVPGLRTLFQTHTFSYSSCVVGVHPNVIIFVDFLSITQKSYHGNWTI
jgi:hypothetical protein